jgi:hypothetical protein
LQGKAGKALIAWCKKSGCHQAWTKEKETVQMPDSDTERQQQ